MRNRDDLVPFADTVCAQGQLERGHSGINPNAVVHPAKGGELLLKEFNIFPEDEVGAGDDAMNGRVHLRSDGVVLRFQINKINFHYWYARLWRAQSASWRNSQSSIRKIVLGSSSCLISSTCSRRSGPM